MECLIYNGFGKGYFNIMNYGDNTMLVDEFREEIRIEINAGNI